jgi:hypothetical protein
MGDDVNSTYCYYLFLLLLVRPLSNRLNIIISTKLNDLTECDPNNNANLDNIIICKVSIIIFLHLIKYNNSLWSYLIE